MPATRGPVPKRDEDRLRNNAPDVPITKVAMSGKVKVPPCPPRVHQIARDWYGSLKESGQSKYFEPSDWAAALLVCREMSRHLENQRPSSEWFKAIWAAMNDLLSTEAHRRRVRMEVERGERGRADEPPDPENEATDPAKVVHLDHYRGL